MKIFLLSLFSLLIVLSSSLDSCTPLWPRIEFGNAYVNPMSSQKVIVKFNTRSPCQKSYVLIENGTPTPQKVYCQYNTIKLSAKMNNYQIFQQRCSVSIIKFDQKFKYHVFGANTTTKSIPHSPRLFQVRMIDPNTTNTVRFINLADWSEIKKKIGYYTSINKTLDTIRRRTDIDGLFINGDICYEIDSDNGKVFEMFMNMLSRTAQYVPVFMNTGNHEHNSQDDMKIYTFTFEQYGKDKSMAVGLSLGSIYLIGFDPYDSLYLNRAYRKLKRQTAQVYASLQYKNLKKSLQYGSKLNKTLVTYSHYPMVCSAPDSRCKADMQLMKDFIDLFFQYKVPLYLSAHVHTYERIYPYCQNKTYIMKPSPYTFTSKDNCMTTIVEGTAGNDRNLVESYEGIQKFTAKAEFNKTGFGVLESKYGYFKYKHYNSVNTITLTDQTEVTFADKFSDE